MITDLVIRASKMANVKTKQSLTFTGVCCFDQLLH